MWIYCGLGAATCAPLTLYAKNTKAKLIKLQYQMSRLFLRVLAGEMPTVIVLPLTYTIISSIWANQFITLTNTENFEHKET